MQTWNEKIVHACHVYTRRVQHDRSYVKLRITGIDCYNDYSIHKNSSTGVHATCNQSRRNIKRSSPKFQLNAMLTRCMPIRSLKLLILNSLDIVRREDSLPVAYPARPPIGFALCALDDCNDFALLEPKIARLVCVECELRDRLAGSCAAAFEAEGRFGRAWPAWGWAFAVGVYVVALVAKCGRATAAGF